MGITESIDQKQTRFCFVCGGPGTQKHHLIPRSRHSKVEYSSVAFLRQTVLVCGKCHVDIHFHFSNLELANKFNTPEALKRELEFRKREDPYSKMVLVQGMNPMRVKSQFEKYALRRW